MTLERIKNNSELVNKYNLYLEQLDIYNKLPQKHASEKNTFSEQQKEEVYQSRKKLKESIEALTTCAQFEATASTVERESMLDLLESIKEEV